MPCSINGEPVPLHHVPCISFGKGSAWARTSEYASIANVMKKTLFHHPFLGHASQRGRD
jgi:hypothetical protein